MRKTHRTIATAIIAVLLSACGGSKQPYTIGVFQFSSNVLQDQTREGFLKAMSEAGYKDGVNVRFQYENAQGDLPTTQLIAKKLANSVDLVLAISTPALQAAIGDVKNKPIVFGAVANPYIIGAGETPDQHLPNVTGASAAAPMREALDLMMKVLPGAKRIGILYDPANANSRFYMDTARQAASDLKIEIIEGTLNGSSEVLQAAQSLATKDIDVFFAISDHIVMDAFDAVVKVANQQHIPIISTVPDLVKLGAALAVGWDYFDNGYLSGKLAIRVMKGESPKDIPFQPLTRKLVYANPTAARTQGLEIPPDVIQQADQVINP